MSIPKLSEAMRLGAMMSEQSYQGRSVEGKRCALQAVADCVGIQMREGQFTPYEALAEVWPVLLTVVPNPIDGRTDFLKCQIYELNDIAHWTRERIADWVQSIEQQLEAQATPQPEVAHVTN